MTSGVAEMELHRHKLSVVDYHRMGDAGVLAPEARVELVEGEIIDMSPIGFRHAAALKLLIARCALLVERLVVLSVQDPVVLDDATEVQPDLALLRTRSDDYWSGHPRPQDVLLIVEVSESSLRYDREVKVPLYARAGIPEVWLVDLNASLLHVHRGSAPGGYDQVETLSDPGELDLEALPGRRIDLSGLF